MTAPVGGHDDVVKGGEVEAGGDGGGGELLRRPGVAVPDNYNFTIILCIINNIIMTSKSKQEGSGLEASCSAKGGGKRALRRG